MEEFRERILAKATEYLNEAPAALSVDLAMEQFLDCRSYPSSFTEEKILADMERSFNKIAMAVVEIDAKEGGEGEISHSESGVSRSYGDNSLPKAYASVIPYATVF